MNDQNLPDSTQSDLKYRDPDSISPTDVGSADGGDDINNWDSSSGWQAFYQ